VITCMLFSLKIRNKRNVPRKLTTDHVCSCLVPGHIYGTMEANMKENATNALWAAYIGLHCSFRLCDYNYNCVHLLSTAIKNWLFGPCFMLSRYIVGLGLDDEGILFQLPADIQEFFVLFFNASIPALGYTQWV